MKKKQFGSGYFGEWIIDCFGLPAYKYTCDQLNDPKAISPVNEEIRMKSEHLHEVGNHRLVGIASNYGYIQVRQDEGGPKFLNDYNPESNQFAGGFGYLSDGKNTISTFYSDKKKAELFERVFGIGYYKKEINAFNLIVNHTIFAPYGDDPILISQVSIKNERNESVNLRWIEYWGTRMFQLSFKAYLESKTKDSSFYRIRRNFANLFKENYEIIGDYIGLLNTKEFIGNKSDFNIEISNIAVDKTNYPNGVSFPVPEASFDDFFPPPTFLISLDAPFDGLSTNSNAFFGEGGIETPDGLNIKLSKNLSPKASVEGMFLEREFTLNSGEEKQLYFAFGYLPDGFDLNTLYNKYKRNIQNLLKESCELWKKNRIKLDINNESWIDRELMWHNYYLQGDLTYDSFFKEHIISQGHIYQYIIGFQSAARDTLQHALPLIFNQPEFVKEVLRYILKTVQKDGRIPYGITGHGMLAMTRFNPSDQQLWLLWLISEYILATRDSSFLEEIIPMYPIYNKDTQYKKVIEITQLCYEFLVSEIGTGEHGLLRLYNGDWNDNVVHGFVPSRDFDAVSKYGESVLNASMASFVLRLYSNLLLLIGENEKAKDVLENANRQVEAVHKQWNGKWFKRAWLAEDIGWLGDELLWLSPQPWSILGGAADESQIPILVKNINKLLREPSKIGAILHSKGIKKMARAAGVGTNAGIWPSINGTLVKALSSIGSKLALDEWKKNSLAFHAEAYPKIWYGIWSGPDTYNSHLSKFPGQTIFQEAIRKSDVVESGVNDPIVEMAVNWTDFPVMNMHTHAWMLYNATNLAGIHFTPEGIEYAPCLSFEEYKFETPLVGLIKTSYEYSGWYNPKGEGDFKMSMKLKEDELKAIKAIEVNGFKTNFEIRNNMIEWIGQKTHKKRIEWNIIK